MHSAEHQQQAEAVRHGARVVRRVRLEEEDRQQDLDDTPRERDIPAAIAHHPRGRALQQPVDEEQRAEDHRQQEVAVMMAGKHEPRGHHDRDAFHVAQNALAADPAAGHRERREPLDQEQPCEQLDREMQRTIERVDENADARHHPQPAEHGQPAP
ncbi:hypothetical protein, partial [Burkholderia cenocepacia]|uniref:hypothetical protein n=1 Tax=Burkholderia cenocepacia TaxID=95486 RepID=UPI00351C58E1